MRLQYNNGLLNTTRDEEVTAMTNPRIANVDALRGFAMHLADPLAVPRSVGVRLWKDELEISTRFLPSAEASVESVMELRLWQSPGEEEAPVLQSGNGSIEEPFITMSNEDISQAAHVIPMSGRARGLSIAFDGRHHYVRLDLEDDGQQAFRYFKLGADVEALSSSSVPSLRWENVNGRRQESDATHPSVDGDPRCWKTRPLAWQHSTAFTCLVCVGTAWLCLDRFEKFVPGIFVLILFFGLNPYYMRRNHYFNLAGLGAVAATGVAMAGIGGFIDANAIVFVWLGMSLVLQKVALETPRGVTIHRQIFLEKQQLVPGRRAWLNTKTQQSEQMLAIGDFAIVAAVVLGGLVVTHL